MTGGGEKKRRGTTTTFPCHFSRVQKLIMQSCSQAASPQSLYLFIFLEDWCFLEAQPWLLPMPKLLGKALRCIAGDRQGSSTAKPPAAAARSFWAKHSKGFLRSSPCSVHHKPAMHCVIHVLSSTLSGHSCSPATYLPPLQSLLILQ